MNELIKVTTDTEGNQTVSGRELYVFLDVSERYNNWFERQLKYGFVENVDYVGCKLFNTLANQEVDDHTLSLDCAKEISMIQRTEQGKLARQYFIQCEKIARKALQEQAPASQLPATYKEALKALLVEVEAKELLEAENAELRPKAAFADFITESNSQLTTTLLAKELGMTARALNKYLKDKGVQFKQSGVWHLYRAYADKGYATLKTYPHTVNGVVRTEHLLVWTEKGRLFIRDLVAPRAQAPTYATSTTQLRIQ